jgi:hypothetical protein
MFYAATFHHEQGYVLTCPPGKAIGITPKKETQMTEPDVSTMTPDLAACEKKRELIRDLMGGTNAMIAAGIKWLPKHAAESQGNYDIRLGQNILTNFLRREVKKAVGKILAKPIQLGENVPEEIKRLTENIDRQGSGLDAFMRQRAEKGFEDGVSYVLCDAPKAEGVQSRAEEKAVGLRPYAVPIDASNLLEVSSAVIGGVQTLTRARFMEHVSVPGGEWDFQDKRRVRVLKRESGGAITYQIWEEVKESNSLMSKWIMIEEGLTSLKRITLVAFYTNRCCYMMGDPPFSETAELNLEHWRSKSEQLHALSFGRFAMLGGSGISQEDADKIQVGPSKKLISESPEGEFYYVESNGVGIEKGFEHLEKIEAAIQSAQASLKVENAGKVTATAAALDSADSNAGLAAICQDMKDNIEIMLMYFAEMMGLGEDAGGEVVLPFEAGQKKGTDTGLQEIGKMTVAGVISRPAYIEELIRREELAEDFDVEANEGAIQADPHLTAPSKEQALKGAARKEKKEVDNMENV